MAASPRARVICSGVMLAIDCMAAPPPLAGWMASYTTFVVAACLLFGSRRLADGWPFPRQARVRAAYAAQCRRRPFLFRCQLRRSHTPTHRCVRLPRGFESFRLRRRWRQQRKPLRQAVELLGDERGLVCEVACQIVLDDRLLVVPHARPSPRSVRPKKY